MSSAPEEVLPEKGLVYTEVKELQLLLCKPKLLPIKSFSLERLERLEAKLARETREKRAVERQLRTAVQWNTSPPPAPTAPTASSSASQGCPLPPKMPPALPPRGPTEEVAPAVPSQEGGALEEVSRSEAPTLETEASTDANNV